MGEGDWPFAVSEFGHLEADVHGAVAQRELDCRIDRIEIFIGQIGANIVENQAIGRIGGAIHKYIILRVLRLRVDDIMACEIVVLESEKGGWLKDL